MSLVTALGGALAVLIAGWRATAFARAVRLPLDVDTTPSPIGSPSAGARRRRSTRRSQRRQLDQCLPDLLDLFVVTVRSGVLPREALEETGRALTDVHPMLADAVRGVTLRCHRGERFVEALHHLVDRLGPELVTFVAVVASTERDGLPLAPSLERLADEARQHRRRAAETAARELPVRLSFPLVLCTLPSFVLVAIVPLLVGALSSLRAA